MIPFEEALSIIKAQNYSPQTEQLTLGLVIGRILARDVFSDIDMPPFDKSAMDGYACRKSDISDPLEVIETISAGTAPRHKISKGQCIKLMTGCMVPEGADCVVKVEETQILTDNRIKFLGSHTSNNICYLGEDIEKGQRVLETGTLIKPWHVAILAAVGCSEPLVYKKLTCGILSTGDELVEPDKKPARSQIRNSNGWQLQAQCLYAGLIPVYYGIVTDNRESLLAGIQKSLDNNDITLITGGVSMGDFDLVPAVMKESGIEILFEKIAVQPGSPTVFGRKGNRFIFGLPGNPVSSLTQFELLINTLITRIYQIRPKTEILKLPVAVDYKREKANRKAFFPVIILGNGSVMPLEYHGSAHIFAYESADGIAELEEGQKSVTKGEKINVRFL